MHIHEKKFANFKKMKHQRRSLENTLHPQLYGLTRKNLIFQLLRILPSVAHMSAEIILIYMD